MSLEEKTRIKAICNIIGQPNCYLACETVPPLFCKEHIELLALIKTEKARAVKEALEAMRFTVNNSHAEAKNMPLLTFRGELNAKIDELLEDTNAKNSKAV